MTPWIRTFSALLAALGLSLSLLASTPSPSTADPKDPTDTPREVAEKALELVQQLTAPPGKGHRNPGKAKNRGEGLGLTTALRDLSASVADLSKADQKTARRFLTRPDEPGGPDCQPVRMGCYTDAERPALDSYCIAGMLCVHYSRVSGPNRIPLEDDGAAGSWRIGTPARNGVPDYAEAALITAYNVRLKYQSAGYRTPLGDGAKGGSGANTFDIYLADLNTAYGQLYGYCSTDDLVTSHAAYAGYCVLDNDFSPRQYGTSSSPLANMWVTTAHEYFHAVQFAYDALEDGWLFEATATWAEDEVYPTINDNAQYLPYGVLGNPSYPLDQFNDYEAYGNWIFFRYLAQRFPHKQGGMATIIRDIWERTTTPNSSSATPGATYSVQAITTALQARGVNLPAELAWFARVNRIASAYYHDAAGFPLAPLRGSAWTTRTSRAKTFVNRLDHLSTATYRFNRSSTLQGNQWKFLLSSDLPNTALGSRVMLTVHRKSRGSTSVHLTLNSGGNGLLTGSFDTDVVWIEVTVVNGGTRYAGCAYGETPPGEGTCGGYPVDEGYPHRITVTAY